EALTIAADRITAQAPADRRRRFGAGPAAAAGAVGHGPGGACRPARVGGAPGLSRRRLRRLMRSASGQALGTNVVLGVTDALARRPAGRSGAPDGRRATARGRRGGELASGPTAKPLAAARAARTIFGGTGSGALVSRGGDVSVVGEPPPGDWPLRIAEDSGD